MKKKIKSLRILRVDWVDSEGLGNWRDREDFYKVKTVPIVSVGLEVKSDEENIFLSVGYDSKLDNFCGSIRIPRCSIKRVRVIGKVKL